MHAVCAPETLDLIDDADLGNLTVIVDVNRLGQDGPTELQWEMQTYAKRVEAFGAHAIVIDGHNLEEIDAALSQSRSDPHQPTVVLARTIKGKGVPEIENENGWHGKALPKDMAERAIAALGGVSDLTLTTVTPDAGEPAIHSDQSAKITLPTWEIGQEVATRAAFGGPISAFAAQEKVVVFDGEVGNSTHAAEFKEVCPDRYFEMFISVQ